ncbi:ribosomal RNA large subunit methyltransferase N [Candidatus Kinetoplastibacterium blastocrithidii TCC012E]|uniref:Dual-specificity RNA methyltransferase RlmN n=1 Tax=Candidatus Kinetoplastidibacterium blastocrithidiae TCC012E TaxID=1208922 RepID=M1LWB9_9PROT|nr:23S rRNA (adenine(2503)-C(2))-methyltransferase RlmN [Candidatus Kinetoplastibacterium blastocrithidii]AFZ83700.1 23S rRNA (adenine2503-C2)-methyltransferase [Candidatus Kinetoplastibacterium blastocrithidii (ex Strigomonas culicis)]AGF49822.1 ribosomal RNA large subunit methyltransferase N [Candidatus Kinetoplastibacterium blastocrithidii TCC012E]
MNNNSLVNLIGLDHESLSLFLEENSIKSSFRATQLQQWIHKFSANSFDVMTNISSKLRDKLKEISKIENMPVKSETFSKDGTVKWLFDVGNNNAIETVFIPEKNRRTLCISSQAGCAVNCAFCSTGHQGFNRNLSANEIISQLWSAQRSINYKLIGNESLINKNSIKDRGNLITNIVFMGMGEPLLNYSEVVQSIKLLLDVNAYGFSRRKVTVSTSGIVPMIDKLARDCPVSLAVSLHAANDVLRNKLVPINKKYPIKELIDSCKRYILRSPRDFITFEYCMLSGINDTDNHLKELISLIKTIKCKVNLIPFNSFINSEFKAPAIEKINSFANGLINSGIMTTVRKTRGNDIYAACGQLSGSIKNVTKIATQIPIKRI